MPPKCTSQMMFDLFYRLLPMNLDSHPFYLNTFLPVFTSTGYGTQNIFLPLKNYVELEEAIIKHVQKHGLTMRGRQIIIMMSAQRYQPKVLADNARLPPL